MTQLHESRLPWTRHDHEFVPVSRLARQDTVALLIRRSAIHSRTIAVETQQNSTSKKWQPSRVEEMRPPYPDGSCALPNGTAAFADWDHRSFSHEA